MVPFVSPNGKGANRRAYPLVYARSLSLCHFSCLLPKQLQLAMNKSWNLESNQRPWSPPCIRLWVWVAGVWWSASEMHLPMQEHHAGAPSGPPYCALCWEHYADTHGPWCTPPSRVSSLQAPNLHCLDARKWAEVMK